MLDEALLTYPELFLWLSYHMKSTHWTQPLHPLSKSDLIMTLSPASAPCTWVMTTALYPWVLRSVTSSSMALLYALRYSSTVWKPPLGSSFAFWSPNQQWPQGIMDWPQVSPSTAALSGSLGANYRDKVTPGQSITSCVMCHVTLAPLLLGPGYTWASAMWPTGKSSQPLAAVTSLRGSLVITSLVTWRHHVTLTTLTSLMLPRLYQTDPKPHWRQPRGWCSDDFPAAPSTLQTQSSIWQSRNIESFSLCVFPGKVLLILFLDLGHVWDTGEVLPHQESHLVSPVIPSLTLCSSILSSTDHAMMTSPLTYLDVFPHHVEAHLLRLLQVPDHRLLTWRGQDTIRPISLHGKYYNMY